MEKHQLEPENNQTALQITQPALQIDWVFVALKLRNGGLGLRNNYTILTGLRAPERWP